MWWFYYVSGSLSLVFFITFIVLGVFFVSLFKTGESVFFSWELFNVSGVSGEVNFVFDWVSSSFGCVVLLISASVMLFTCEYMKGDPFLSRFSWLVFLFVLSMSFVIFIPNLFSILIGWDGLGLVSFLLVVYYQNFKSLSGGMITVLMNRIGDVMILLSIGLLCKEGGWNFFYLTFDGEVELVVLFVLLAGMTKSAQVPFSSWLPAAMAAPTPVSALVHSSTLVTAGVFLLIRFYSFLSGAWWFEMSLLIIACITMFMAGIAANLESDLKKIIALSTLSQLGVMMAALGLGAWKMALFHLYTHALFKALLFVCAGSFIHRSQHGQDLRCSGMVWNRAPVIVSSMHIANLALCGAPFLAGFYSKDLILEFSLFTSGNIIILFMIFLATGMTVMYSVRLSYFALWSTNNFYSMSNWGDESIFELIPVCCLMIGGVVGGSLLSWFFFSNEGVLSLSLFEKLITIFVVSMGGLMGWVLNYSKVFSESSRGFFASKNYFGMTYMWFLVHVSSQGVVKEGLRVGSRFLYQSDRGWLEVMGGEGAYSLIKSFLCSFQDFSFNSVMVYISSIIFIVVGTGVWFIF